MSENKVGKIMLPGALPYQIGPEKTLIGVLRDALFAKWL